MSKARKSPQQKKRLSLLKDRRNTYGENSKASRKAIPRRKKHDHGSARRGPAQLLTGAIGRRSADIEESVQERVGARRRRRAWRKTPDEALGVVLGNKLQGRANVHMIRAEQVEKVKGKIGRRTRR